MKAAIGLFAVLVAFVSNAQSAVTVSLEDAVRQGKVHVDVRSLGGATGDGVRVDVRSLVGEELHVVVEPGTVLLNASANHQNLGIGALQGELTNQNNLVETEVMVLADRNPRSFLLEIFCLDEAKPDPAPGTSLKVSVKDARVARILAAAPKLDASIWAKQLAIWIDRSGISVERAHQLHPGKFSEVDVKVAHQLVKQAEADGVKEIPEDMPADVRVQVGRLYSPQPAVRAMAAETLGAMGAKARVAIPFLAENLLDRSTDKPLTVNVKVGDGKPLDLLKGLENLGLPGLGPLLSANAAGRTRIQLKIPGLEGLKLKVPGVEIRDGQLLIDTESALPSGQVMLETLVKRLDSPSATVRNRAVWLLGTLNNRKAVEPLIGMLDHEDKETAQAAAEALQSLTGQDLGTSSEKWKAWWAEHQDEPLPAEAETEVPRVETPEDDAPAPKPDGETLPPPVRR